MNDEERNDVKKIAQAICEQNLENLERQRSLERSEQRIQRSQDWSNRFLAGVIGLAIGMVFVFSLTECSRFTDRVRALESKQK